MPEPPIPDCYADYCYDQHQTRQCGTCPKQSDCLEDTCRADDWTRAPAPPRVSLGPVGLALLAMAAALWLLVQAVRVWSAS